MRVSLLPLSADSYTSHALHLGDRPWTETNCWTDAMIELLHALDLEPLASAAFTVATDFEGDQWQMYKFPPGDLWSTYGIEVHEMNPYRELEAQITDLLSLGRMMTVEVDSWHLPDTRGITYRMEHQKSSIIVNEIDTDERRLGYFHNAGYYEAQGEDYDGLLRVGRAKGGPELVPYVELINLDGLHRDREDQLAEHAMVLLKAHLARRPHEDPVMKMATRFSADLEWIRAAGEGAFHSYAFVTARQAGAAADTVRAFCEWLAELDPEAAPALRASATSWTGVSDSAKSLQLKLARVARGRSVDLEETFAVMSSHWVAAQRQLDALSR